MSLFKLLLNTAYGLWIKLLYAGSSAWGWVISQVVFVCSFLGTDNQLLLKILWIVVFLDLVGGITTSIKLKKHVLSQAIIKSAIKYGLYTGLFWIMCATEKGIGVDEWYLGSKAIFAFSVAAEVWSILAHVAILRPDLIIVRVLRRALAGEVGKKLGTTPEEAILILDGKETTK